MAQALLPHRSNKAATTIRDREMTNLTTRSKITVRWTTNPADLGYDGQPSNWKEESGETMSVKAAANFDHELNQRIGNGTYRAVQYSNNGRIVSKSEILDVLADADYRKMVAR